MTELKPVVWNKTNLRVLDRSLNKYIECSNHYEIAEIIKTIGNSYVKIIELYGLVLAAQKLIKSNGQEVTSWDETFELLEIAAKQINEDSYRLFDILKEVKRSIADEAFSDTLLERILLSIASTMEEKENKINEGISKHSAAFIENGMQILLHHYSPISLIPLLASYNKGKKFTVYCCETRPLLQGSKITALELKKAGIDCNVVCDNSVAHLMCQKRIDMVIVDAKKIAKNGDLISVAGTYQLAVTSRYHDVPFVVIAPFSALDIRLPNGDNFVTKVKSPEEITHIDGHKITDSSVYNPDFDVTPYPLITAIVTNEGIISPVNEDSIKNLLKRPVKFDTMVHIKNGNSNIYL